MLCSTNSESSDFPRFNNFLSVLCFLLSSVFQGVSVRTITIFWCSLFANINLKISRACWK